MTLHIVFIFQEIDHLCVRVAIKDTKTKLHSTDILCFIAVNSLPLLAHIVPTGVLIFNIIV